MPDELCLPELAPPKKKKKREPRVKVAAPASARVAPCPDLEPANGHSAEPSRVTSRLWLAEADASAGPPLVGSAAQELADTCLILIGRGEQRPGESSRVE